MSAAGYIEEVRRQLTLALCLHNFPSQQVERHNKPEIEVRTSPELLLPPVTVRRNDSESCLIEQSINSSRVSFKFKATDQVEEYLIRTYLSFMVHRAEQLEIVRRVPLEGYDITFLFTNSHVERFRREKLVNFVCQLVEGFNAEVSEMKLSLKTRARAIVDDFWRLTEQQLLGQPQ